jgi:hypothetical protein
MMDFLKRLRDTKKNMAKTSLDDQEQDIFEDDAENERKKKELEIKRKLLKQKIDLEE